MINLWAQNLKKIMKQTFNKQFKFLSTDRIQSYMLDSVPNNVLSDIEPLIKNIQSNFNTSYGVQQFLAGQIDNEYALEMPPSFDNYLKSSVESFLKETHLHIYAGRMFGDPQKMGLNNEKQSWVNFQGKTEYNPPHWHSGLISWVLWYKIPYNIEKEKVSGPGKYKTDFETNPQENPVLNSENRNINGHFYFLYPGSKSIIVEPLPVDETWNGTICLFPADLTHGVHPFFTSDDYRITIAGNVQVGGNS